MNVTVDQFQDIRDLCSQFPAEYFRKVDEERGHPEAFQGRIINCSSNTLVQREICPTRENVSIPLQP